ncbi:glycosyltransferase family protein [Pseudactinotalea sp. Z1739]|uniref:glycosyltransferase family protein n=1 Tax=Pseudactinotalea sp. Z1739 TaxID=3413028 RepID=UPI003C7D5404
MSRLHRARVALWHLRTGGHRQLRKYLNRSTTTRHTPSLLEGQRDAHGHLTFPPWPLPERAPRRQMRVAVILDDFSRLAFSYEWVQVELTPSSWRKTLTEHPVEMLFVESAWHGNADAWQYHLTGTSAPRPQFVELVEWCRTNGVPTVFWNKEDPAHYADFLDSARLFDHVFTTDANRLDVYRRDLGHERIGLLPFAAQQSIHNPVRPSGGHQHRDIAFAGMYFAHRYPERREQMDLLLGAAEAVSPRMETGLEIFSRYLGADDRYQFPPPLDQRVVGSLTYDRMLSANRAYKVFLNVNSVVDSPSMCARRIFEITASGTPVVSTPSPAIEHYFTADMVAQVHDRQEAEHTLRALVRSRELRDRMVHRAQRRIWSEHTYTRRVDAVLDRIGAEHRVKARPTVSVLVSTNRPAQIEHVLATIAAQQDVDYELLLLAHGFDLPETETRDQANEHGIERIEFLSADAQTPLGECLNILARAATGDVVAKVDDDDLYGPQYLSDQVYAMDYAGADVVGKQAHFMYLADPDATVLRFPEREHRYTDFVAGPTIVARRDLVLSHPFPAVPRGEDTGFLDAASAAGATIYSADRFNFIQHRRATTSGNGDHRHTWNTTDTELLANADVQFYGHNPAHVMV